VTTARLSRAIVAAALTGLVAATSACGSDAGGSDAASPTSAAAGSAATSSPAPAVPPAPFGPGCAGLPADGPGSLAAMAALPVGTALSQNPLTTSLTQTVLAANLVDVLNTRQDITVLAPVNTAFQPIDAGELSALVGDVPRLTAVLTHHVLNGRLTPDQRLGEHTTLGGGTVTVAGSGTDLTVAVDQTLAGAAPATVVCGNVPTANAMVYLVDQVLTPPAAG
jgi:uncharacterized surface protein with fasciclin (FAS1) repeats